MGWWTDASAVAAKSKDLIGFMLAVAGGSAALVRYNSSEAWNRAKYASKQAEKIYADPACALALEMIDWFDSARDVPACLGAKSGETVAWGGSDVAKALRTSDARFTTKEYYIRGAFDALLNKLDQIGFAVGRRLLGRSDFPASLLYYFRKLEERPELGKAFALYVKHYGFENVDRIWPNLGKMRSA